MSHMRSGDTGLGLALIQKLHGTTMEDRMIQKEIGESVQPKPSQVVNTTVNQGSPQTEADHKKQVFRVIRESTASFTSS